MIYVDTLGKEQYVIVTKRFKVFQSYGTMVSIIDTKDPIGEVLYFTPTKYSKTTTKYFNMFKQHYHSSGIFQICDQALMEELLDE